MIFRPRSRDGPHGATVFAGVPHQVTQRGNGRAQTFFEDDGYRAYRDLLAEQGAAAGVEVWNGAPMPNHVRLILTPRSRPSSSAWSATAAESFGPESEGGSLLESTLSP